MGKQSGEFFEKVQDEYGRKSYRLKSLEQYSREHKTKEQPSKKYFQASTLEEIIRSYPMPRKNMRPVEVERGKCLGIVIILGFPLFANTDLQKLTIEWRSSTLYVAF